MNKYNSFPRIASHALLWIAIVLLPGCRPNQTSGPAASDSNRAKNDSEDLAIVGYNYTNRAIGHFTVNGIGGGNVAPGGGGGITCCARFSNDGKASRYVVRWDASSCRFNEKVRPAGNESFDLAYYYKEQAVEVSFPGSGTPGYFEVHFLPDGAIEAKVTAEMSPPKFSQQQPRLKPARSPQCPGNVKPSDAS